MFVTLESVIDCLIISFSGVDRQSRYTIDTSSKYPIKIAIPIKITIPNNVHIQVDGKTGKNTANDKYSAKYFPAQLQAGFQS